MKKFLIILIVFLVAACDSKVDLQMHDANFPGCQRIDTHSKHLVYKCPARYYQHRVVREKEVKAGAVFKRSQGLPSIREIRADRRHSYVEVVLNSSKWCNEGYYYRELARGGYFDFFRKKSKRKYRVTISCPK